MGSRAQVRVCYGIDYGACEEGGDAAKFENPDAEPAAGDTSPAGLGYYGEPPGFPVEVVTYGHHDYRRVVLAAAGTVRSKTYEAIDLTDVGDPPDSASGALLEYCESHGLTFKPPRWLALPYYG